MRRKSHRRHKALIETLEKRDMCAIDVSVVNGDLVLQGTPAGAVSIVDQGDGTIAVTEAGAGKEGEALTTILSGVTDDIWIRFGNGSESTSDNVSIDLSNGIVAIDQVFASLGGGDNTFEWLGGSIKGSLQVRAGSGADTVSISESTTIEGRVALSLGSGDNLAEIGGTLGKSLSVSAGTGDDIVNLLAGSVIEGPVQIQLGDGANTLVSGAELGRSLSYQGGSGDDSVTLEETSLVDGNVRIRLGAGANEARIDGTINGNLAVLSSNEEDSVAIQDTADILGRTDLALGGVPEPRRYGNGLSLSQIFLRMGR